MYFGTRYHRSLIPDPAPDFDASALGWSRSTTMLNGGSRVRSSGAAHRIYNLQWPVKSIDEMRRLFDYADGVYDDEAGSNPIYFSPPWIKRWNVLPQAWAFPAQGAIDAMPLIRKERPSTTTTPNNDLGYPTLSAVYQVAGDEDFETVYLPIDPGDTLWIGAHGDSTDGATVRVTPFKGTMPDTPTDLTLIDVTSSTRVNASFSSNDYTGVELQIAPESGLLTLSGLIAQAIPTGETPKLGDYISGLGHSGCSFDGKPTTNVYRTDGDLTQVVVSAVLRETVQWR